MAIRMPQLERIMKRVTKRDDGCWEWIGKSRTGLFNEYGGTRLSGRMMSTHRAVWILIKKSVPKDLLHQCPMKLCCNPDHLREGTHRENIMEAITARGKPWGVCKPAGDDHPARKVSLKDEEAINKRYLAGEKQRVIASKYGITQARVCQINKKIRLANQQS